MIEGEAVGDASRRWALAGIFALTVVATAAPAATSDPPTTPAGVHDRPAVFTGEPPQPEPLTSGAELRIGLFAPDPTTGPVARDLVHGITLVLDRTNADGGIDGHPLSLIRRWSDDPWRGGAREVTRMVYEDGVAAILGGPDAASTHVAEQVATKAWRPLVAPVASDPSLTRTRVPWVFRLAPDDAAQARRLAGQVAVLRAERVGVVTGVDRDSRAFAEEIGPALAAVGRPPACHLELASDFLPEVVFERLARFDLDALILRLPPDRLAALTGGLDEAGSDCDRLLPWIPGLETSDTMSAHARTWRLRPISSTADDERRRGIMAAFRERWNEEPSDVALMASDAAELMVAALRLHLASGRPLVEVLRGLSGFQGAAATFEWDPGGGSRAEPLLVLGPSR